MSTPFICEGQVKDRPTWCFTDCDLIEATFEDEVIAVADACKKIVRHWTVIDWCTYVPNSGRDDDIGGDDAFEAVDDEWLGEENWLPNIPEGEPCISCDKASGDLGSRYFRYSSVDRDGYYTFNQVIKILDRTPPEVIAPDTIEVSVADGAQSKEDNFDDCFAATTVSATVMDMCGDVRLTSENAQWEVTISGTNGIIIDRRSLFGDSVSLTTPYGRPGEDMIITWIATDGCTNSAATTTLVRFVDDKRPTPVCIQDLSTALMPSSGEVQIWASDYDLGSFDNCSETEAFFKNEEGELVSSLTFDCGDIPSGINSLLELELYVVDADGLEDFCNVRISIEDTQDVCPNVNTAAALIAGEIRTEEEDMVEDAMVQLNTGKTMMTPNSGEYAFDNNPLTAFYEIDPFKNDDFTNGLSVLDMVLIQRHILGLRAIEGPYKIIAADVNSDRRISTLDLVQLRRLILGLDDKFINNTSWRFVPADFSFIDASYPWPFEEQIEISSLGANMYREDFIGVKIGDVNGNVIANSLLSSGRSEDEISLAILDRYVTEGQRIEIPINLSERIDLIGIQMAIQSEGLELEGWIDGDIRLQSEQIVTIDKDEVATAWHQSVEGDAITLDQSSTLFTLIYTATRSGYLRDMMSLEGTRTQPLAYDQSDREYALEIEFYQESTSHLVLEQNEPNPFKGRTQIGFSIPDAGDVRFDFYDITGRLLHTHEEYYNAGIQELIVTKDQLKADGMIRYRMTYDGVTLSKTMVMIR